jgi:class 3 adenylate cyclase
MNQTDSKVLNKLCLGNALKSLLEKEKYFIYLGVFLFVSLIHWGAGDQGLEILNKKIAWPLEFDYRESKGLDPKISDQLMIITFDEPSISKMRRTKLNLTEWFDTLVFLESLDPKAIVFNQFLEVPHGIYDFEDKPEYKFPNTYVPLSRSFSKERAKLVDKMPAKYLVENASIGQYVEQINSLDLKLVDKFAGFGESNYFADGKIDLLAKDPENNAAFHLGLVASSPRLEGEAIRTSKFDFNNNQSRNAVNFISKKRFTDFIVKKNISLYKLSNPRFKKALAKHLKNKVIVLSAENKGSASGKRESPVGDVRNSHVLYSVINSSLTGNWITETKTSSLLIYFAIFIASVIPVLYNTALSSLILVSLPLIVSYGGVYLFANHGQRIEWLSFSITWFAAGSLSMVGFLFYKEMNAKKVKRALAGIMPREQIKRIADNPKALDTRPKEKNITIMFIDIIGFSLVSESTKPDVAFSSLKETLSGITKIIHRYGGVVDKTLGDGVLCFFGGALVDGENKDENHAQLAVECANQIQQYSVERVLISEVRNLPPFPVRIGINTSEVFIGNIGNEERYDFTIIGSGVNFAQRLEAACEPFKVLIGTGTFVSLDEGLKAEFLQRHINIKHHEELIEAFETDPFRDNEKLVDKADQIMRDFHSISRGEERIPLGDFIEITLSTGEDFLNVNNFSLNGFAAKSDRFFGKKVSLSAQLTTNDEEISKLVDSLGINPIKIEVCWGRVLNDGSYLHGLMISSLNQTQKEILFKTIKERLTPPVPAHSSAS